MSHIDLSMADDDLPEGTHVVTFTHPDGKTAVYPARSLEEVGHMARLIMSLGIYSGRIVAMNTRGDIVFDARSAA